MQSTRRRPDILPVRLFFIEPRIQSNLKFNQTLEVKSQFRCQGPGRDVMRPAKRRQEVVQHIIIGNVNRRQPRTPFVPFTMKQIVIA